MLETKQESEHYSNRIFQIAWLLWDNAIFPKKKIWFRGLGFNIRWFSMQSYFCRVDFPCGFGWDVCCCFVLWLGVCVFAMGVSRCFEWVVCLRYVHYMVLFYYVSGPIILLEKEYILLNSAGWPGKYIRTPEKPAAENRCVHMCRTFFLQEYLSEEKQKETTE